MRDGGSCLVRLKYSIEEWPRQQPQDLSPSGQIEPAQTKNEKGRATPVFHGDSDYVVRPVASAGAAFNGGKEVA